MVLTIFMTVYFQSSSRLTDAYGLTVSSVSVITTVLFMMVIRLVWKRSLIFVILFSLFLIIDCLFWSANVIKFIDGKRKLFFKFKLKIWFIGAWIALLIALIFFIIGFSWYYGQRQLKNYMRFQLATAALNELTMRFGLTSQRQQSVYVVKNQHFDTQRKYFSSLSNIRWAFIH